MALRFFKKTHRKDDVYHDIVKQIVVKNNDNIQVLNQEKKNKKVKKNDDMNTELDKKIKEAEETLKSMEPQVKVVKTEKGIIERTESSKIILAEDNRQLLID
jgi:hypothetical protein